MATCSTFSVFAADWLGEKWADRLPVKLGLNQTLLEKARDYALTGGGSGIVIHRGQAVMRWGSQQQTFDLKSTSKSIGGIVLGLAMKDRLASPDDLAANIHPTFGTPPDSNESTAWLAKITLRMLANQTAGFAKRGGYEPLLFEPDTQWHYSDSGPNWLAECLTVRYRRDLNEVLFERVFNRIGVTPKDLRWRPHQYRPKTLIGVTRREFGSGFHANVPAMARIGYLYLRNGWWQGEKILPREFIDALRTPSPHLSKLKTHDAKTYGEAAPHHGMLWWNNRDGTLAGLPKDATWSWGLHDSLILVVPSLDLVVARAGRSLKRKGWSGHYDVLKPFFEPIAAAIKSPIAFAPPSRVIKSIRWAPKESIIRLAKGSDNWPLTWADDGHLYTAYGDGWGFEPKVKGKLSLGLARVEGTPPDVRGINIRSATAEAKGGGKHGRKASGMLMVEDVLYMWVRNAGNSQLGWSHDHGRTWEWADWKFTTSFGHPTFLNYGKNHAGSRDDHIYIYSQDADTAYDRADRFVLARVHRQHLRDRSHYTFFTGTKNDQPTWTGNIRNRAAVFTNQARCYRSSVSYHPGLKRYLWCQTGPGGDTRFSGGFTILDAPEPWGPWTTAFHTDKWDVGPGESMHLPTKWIIGNTLWLVFSGDDHFSVRKGELIRNRSSN